MREYEFRGKCKDTNGWVDAGLLIVKGFGDGMRCWITTQDVPEDYPDEYEVIPETVGEWTGLKDKNGVNIFEGDILRQEKFNHATPYNPEVEIDEVVFKNGCFLVFDDYLDYVLNSARDCEIEIIGNIHDNPELLNKD